MNRIKQELQTMLLELEANALIVVLTPASEPMHEGHQVRTVYMQNSSWYRRLCEEYTAHRNNPRRRRKHDTAIKRSEIVRILNRMIEGKDTKSKYKEALLEIAKRRLGLYGDRLSQIQNSGEG